MACILRNSLVSVDDFDLYHQMSKLEKIIKITKATSTPHQTWRYIEKNVSLRNGVRYIVTKLSKGSVMASKLSDEIDFGMIYDTATYIAGWEKSTRAVLADVGEMETIRSHTFGHLKRHYMLKCLLLLLYRSNVTLFCIAFIAKLASGCFLVSVSSRCRGSQLVFVKKIWWRINTVYSTIIKIDHT